MKSVMRLAAGFVLVSLVSGCGDNEVPSTTPEEETSTLDSSMTDTTVADTGSADTGSADTTVEETIADTLAETTAETSVDAPAETAVDTAIADAPDTKVVDAPDTTVVDAADTAVVDAADTAVVDAADTFVADTALMCTTPLPAPACNTIAMPASATFVTGVVGTIPTFTDGGTYPPGYYVLVKEIISTGTPGTRKEVFLTVGGCLQDYSIKLDGTELRANATSVSSGGMETATFTCPFVATAPGARYGIKSISAAGKYTIITQGTVGASTTYREWEQQ